MLASTKKYDVSEALVQLLDFIAMEKQCLDNEFASALQAEKHDTANNFIEICRDLLSFQVDVARLVGEWKKIEDIISTAKRNFGETSKSGQEMTESLAATDTIDSGRRVVMTSESLAAYQRKKQDEKNREYFTPPGRPDVPTAFQIKPDWVVRAGDWIEHETYGYGKIIRVNTVPNYSGQTDGHQVWFSNEQRDVMIRNHQLKQGTIRIIPETDVPEAILERAPA